MAEICNECGDSVEFGSGKFVNRIPDLNDDQTREEMGKPFPTGEFMCIDCESKIYADAHRDGEEYCPDHGFRESYMNVKDESGEFIGCYDGCESAKEYDQEINANS